MNKDAKTRLDFCADLFHFKIVGAEDKEVALEFPSVYHASRFVFINKLAEYAHFAEPDAISFQLPVTIVIRDYQKFFFPV